MSRNPAPAQEENLYDITTAAAAAEAEILERNARNATKAKAEAGSEPEPRAAVPAGEDDTPIFYPPVDIFATPSNWTLQFTIPGAKKEDVSVRWDGNKSAVAVKGRVNCPGGEEGFGDVVSRESTVGEFARAVRSRLPKGAARRGRWMGRGSRAGWRTG